MGHWELWEDPDGSTTFFRSDNAKSRRMVEAAGAVLIWETDATGGNAAMQALHDHLGLEPYQPMLRKDGTPYPEDEDDSLLPPR
ncbi:MAG TPA: hypothetical protein VEI83_13645 [Acidimicrobiales bacterium]|nr:hypothetical protein [Acidimicrobiales bacterium]